MERKYTLYYHPEAEKEYVESVEWYENNRTNLGFEFIQAIEKVLNNIESNPYLYPEKFKNVREAVVKTFPYLIGYKIKSEEKEIEILSVFHTKRNPNVKLKRYR